MKMLSARFKLGFIAFTSLLFLFRTTVSSLKYLFLLLFIIAVVYTLFTKKNELKPAIGKFVRHFYLPIILALFIVISFFLSSKIYLIVFKDIINILILFALFFISIIYIETREDLKNFYFSFVNASIYLGLLITLILLITFFNLVPANGIISQIVFGSLSQDYNFALIPVFFGMTSTMYLIYKTNNIKQSWVYNLLLIVFVITIFFSGSRRGLLVLFMIMACYVFVFFLSYISKTIFIIRIRKAYQRFFILLLVFFILISCFIFFVPVTVKRSLLSEFGISIRTYKISLSNKIYKYSSIIASVPYEKIEKLIWNEKINSINPESGWDIRKGSVIFPLTGKNVEIVPPNSIGFKMDKTCDGSTWDNNAYSYTNIQSLIDIDPISGKRIFTASVYCYVSEDFNGTWARLAVEGNSSGKVISEYDLTQKGKWQKLVVKFTTMGEISPVYLYWSKFGVTDFTTLNGYVIYAHPEYKLLEIDPKDPDSGWGVRSNKRVFPLEGNNVGIVPVNTIGYLMDKESSAATWSNNSYSFTDISLLFNNKNVTKGKKKLFASVYCFVSKDFNGTWVTLSDNNGPFGSLYGNYDLNKRGSWQKLNVNFESEDELPQIFLYWSKSGVTDFSTLTGYVIFAYPQYDLINGKNLGITSLKEDNFDLGIYCKSVKKAGLFPLILLKSIQQNQESDPVRRFAINLIKEDTVYYGYKKNLSIDNNENNFIGPRLMRWQFAWKIYKEEFNLGQKIFGGGFNYLNWFGFKFQNNRNSSDYPHNPFLSVILYSGIIGLFIYVIFLYRLIILYIKNARQFPLFVIFFLITFFFSFFSAGNPFDPPVMGFLALIPFLFNHVNKGNE
jgi:hypothetical protein